MREAGGGNRGAVGNREERTKEERKSERRAQDKKRSGSASKGK